MKSHRVKPEDRRKICVFDENRVKTQDFVFGTQKGTLLRETRSFDVLIVKIDAAALGWRSELEEPKNYNNTITE